MWYTNQRAIFESFKLLRAIYPDSDLTLLVTGISKDEVEKYNNNFVNIIKDKFNIDFLDTRYKEVLIEVPSQKSWNAFYKFMGMYIKLTNTHPEDIYFRYACFFFF